MKLRGTTQGHSRDDIIQEVRQLLDRYVGPDQASKMTIYARDERVIELDYDERTMYETFVMFEIDWVAE